MATFEVPISGPKPDRIPGVLAAAGVASEGRFGSAWAAVLRADSADAARQRVADVVSRDGYAAGPSRVAGR